MVDNLPYILLALLLIFLNGVFVAAEFAMVKVRNTQINTIRNSKKIYDRILVRINSHLDAYLSACQLGITLTSLALGWIGEPAAAVLLKPLIELLQITDPKAIEAISFTTAFILISFLHIVAGELLPKSLSIRFPFKTSLITGVPIFIFYYVTYPAIWLLNTCSNLLLKLIISKQDHQERENYSTQEIKFILNSSRASGEITADEAEIMEHTLDFADLRITEVMRPKDELISLNEDGSLEELVPLVLSNKYTRYPIYRHNPENIVGLIHVKDIFINDLDDKQQDLKQLIRPILKISAKNTALDVLKKFKSGHSHLALIYKGKDLLGFVTLDNLLHVIIGKIKDEFNHTTDDWTKNADNSITTDGDCSIYSLEQALDIDIPANEEGTADNVAQLITHKLGYAPRENEIVQIENLIFCVVGIKDGVINKVIIKKLENAPV